MELSFPVKAETETEQIMDSQNMHSADISYGQKPPGRKGFSAASFFGGMAVGILSALLMVSVGFLGYQIQKAIRPTAENAEIEFSEDSAVTPEMVQKLQKLENTIRNYYYQDEDIDASAMTDGVYYGMLDSLGDPYSTYYSPAELIALMEQTEGVYYGIGAYVTLDTVTGYPKIVSAIAGTPAEEADLRPDDVLYEVDGESTYGLSLDETVAKIKGEEGTTVTLTLVRNGEKDYLYKVVERRRVETPTVNYEMLEDGMAYLQITEFDDVTVRQFSDALSALREEGMKGLILDLRSNPGGSLAAVVKICQQILPKGLVVYTKDKYGKGDEYRSDGKSAFDLPLVVLVNSNSASASEIMAGAIQDYELGTLVGTTTFGKGIVQQIIDLRDGSAVKLTISSYFTPEGRNIHGIGIEPDIVCEFDSEMYYGEEEIDNQLDKAKEVLEELMR